MLVEGIGKVTFVNGVLRVQTICINASGEQVESGTIEVPGSSIGDVINGLASATNGINSKLAENAPSSDGASIKDTKKAKSKKKK
tara:strand:+ start:576 stop:830 length:255 start_codon:yes stop_codon:yes gene_type:complete